MIQTTEDLVRLATDPRLKSQPRWVQKLISDLAARMISAEKEVIRVKERAAKEVDEARTLLAQGPEGSDTFMDLPYSQVDSGTDDFEQRPLGTGVNIEFRGPGDEPGEGISARWRGGQLEIHGINTLAVLPVGTSRVNIKAV